jgi:hypothetical protein
MADNWWEAAPVVQQPTKAAGGIGTAKQRGDALRDYQSAVDLGAVIQDIEAKYKAGPGKTKGAEGLLDYLPLPQNKALDVAGNQLRGFIKSAQGMTGGENNTATEAAMNIGPFIPQSSDYDTVIEDKLAALRREQARALRANIAILGGVPDAGGRIQRLPGAPGVAAPRAAPVAAPAPAAAPKPAAKRLRFNPATGEIE